MKVPHSDCYVPLPLAVDLPVGAVLGDYVIEQRLDEGGTATVYGAVHRLIGKKAAVKVISSAMSSDPGHVQRFVQEARAANAVRHPNIVDVFDFGQLPDGRMYFMMEWLQGETLYHRMSGGRLTLDESLHVASGVLDALEAVHEHGIVHRDLKPANVFLVPVRGHHPTPKLLDFGVAKLLHPGEPTGTVGSSTLSGPVVGTPEYLSPEQALGVSVDGRTDLYALGVLLYEMVLGQLPIVADSPVGLVRGHVMDPPTDPRLLWPRIPPRLERLLLGLLGKDPAARPTATEVRAALDELRTETGAPTEPVAEPARRSRKLVIAGVVLCLGGLALALRGPARQRKPEPARSVVSAPPMVRPTDPPLAEGHPTATERIQAPVAISVTAEPTQKPVRMSKRPHRRDPDYLVDPFGAGRVHRPARSR